MIKAYDMLLRKNFTSRTAVKARNSLPIFDRSIQA